MRRAFLAPAKEPMSGPKVAHASLASGAKLNHFPGPLSKLLDNEKSYERLGGGSCGLSESQFIRIHRKHEDLDAGPLPAITRWTRVSDGLS